MKIINVHIIFVVVVILSTTTFGQELPKLSNISGRAQVTPETPLIGGFVIKSKRQMLIRAIGPTLSSFRVTGANKDPFLTLYGQNKNGTHVITSNDNWDNDLSITHASSAIGAFSLPPNTKDAALLITLEAGEYTAVVSCSDGADGIALLEIYDTDWKNGIGIANLSLRGLTGADDKALIPGFVIADAGKSTGEPNKGSGVILIRAIGPGLEQFGVKDFIPDPILTLRQNNFPIFRTDNWWETYSNYFMTSRGAFPLPPGSKDAVVTLATHESMMEIPRVLTVVAEDKEKRNGCVLIEIYVTPFDTPL